MLISQYSKGYIFVCSVDVRPQRKRNLPTLKKIKAKLLNEEICKWCD